MAHSGHSPTENSPFSLWIILKVLCATRYVYESKLFINNKTILRRIFNNGQRVKSIICLQDMLTALYSTRYMKPWSNSLIVKLY